MPTYASCAETRPSRGGGAQRGWRRQCWKGWGHICLPVQAKMCSLPPAVWPCSPWVPRPDHPRVLLPLATAWPQVPPPSSVGRSGPLATLDSGWHVLASLNTLPRSSVSPSTFSAFLSASLPPRLLWPHSLPPLLSPSSFLSPSFSNLFSEHDVLPHPILSPFSL